MKVKEIQAKSVLVKTKLPGADFVINPYVGCSHACVYCYARFMKRFTGHNEPWGSFVDVKINTPEILKKQLKHLKQRTYHVLLSSVTDSYQPIEKKCKLTRKILQIFLDYLQFEIEIITKSDLVLRDLDILKKLRKVRVVFSLGVSDDKIAGFIEPGASLPSKRIKALGKIHEAGIKTSAFISPILPGLTDFNKTFSQLKGKVDEVFGETFNPRGANFTNLALVLKSRFPKLLPEYKKIFLAPHRSGAGFTDDHQEYLKKTKKDFYQTAKKYHLPVWNFFTH